MATCSATLIVGQWAPGVRQNHHRRRLRPCVPGCVRPHRHYRADHRHPDFARPASQDRSATRSVTPSPVSNYDSAPISSPSASDRSDVLARITREVIDPSPAARRSCSHGHPGDGRRTAPPRCGPPPRRSRNSTPTTSTGCSTGPMTIIRRPCPGSRAPRSGRELRDGRRRARRRDRRDGAGRVPQHREADRPPLRSGLRPAPEGRARADHTSPRLRGQPRRGQGVRSRCQCSFNGG